MIIVKRLILVRNNVTMVRVEPRSCGQGRCKTMPLPSRPRRRHWWLVTSLFLYFFCNFMVVTFVHFPNCFLFVDLLSYAGICVIYFFLQSFLALASAKIRCPVRRIAFQSNKFATTNCCKYPGKV